MTDICIENIKNTKELQNKIQLIKIKIEQYISKYYNHYVYEIIFKSDFINSVYLLDNIIYYVLLKHNKNGVEILLNDNDNHPVIVSVINILNILIRISNTIEIIGSKNDNYNITLLTQQIDIFNIRKDNFYKIYQFKY